MHSGEHGRGAKTKNNINFDNDEIKLLVLEKKACLNVLKNHAF